jgi:hypothetical protein
MGLVFFPLVDRGIFAIGLGLGIAPAILLLVMLLTYSVTMSFVYHLLNRSLGLIQPRQCTSLHVRFGSLADIEANQSQVRFTPESGHQMARMVCPLSAKSRQTSRAPL